MYELKYKHDIPLGLPNTVTRRHATIPKIRVLLSETRNTCPICKSIIQSSNIASDKKYIGNIAHIYARNNFFVNKDKISKDMFPNYYHIQKKEELDETHNLILLCEICHENYDKISNINYESYKAMLEKKKELSIVISEEEKLYNAVIYLNENIDLFKEKATRGLFNTFRDKGFKKKKVVKKFKNNGIDISKVNSTYKKEIINTTLNNLRKYYILLDNNEELTVEKIQEVGLIYDNLKNGLKDKEKILNIMFNIMTKNNTYEYVEQIQAIISYCIMKCEVLDNE